MNFSPIMNWEYPGLRNWLKNPFTQESWDYDFKSRIPEIIRPKIG
jgi:hypothetical protein